MNTNNHTFSGFRGYIWLSNASKPTIIKEEDTIVLADYKLPFIEEGFLENAESFVRIKNVNGSPRVYIYTIEHENDKLRLLPEHTFPTHKAHFGEKFVKFAELQELQEFDGFEEWITVSKVFKGFTEKNK